MKLIEQSYEILEQGIGLEGIYKQIELAGRTCYKSEDKITEDSAKKFVDKMIKLGHTSMLEHGTVYLLVPFDTRSANYKYDKYSKVVDISSYEMDNKSAVTTNLRVLYENDWLDDLKFICEPTKYHERRITVKWHVDRVTGESFLRHRVFSFARESTRYCNYSKNKFGNQLTFIVPNWIDTDNLYTLNGKTLEVSADETFCSTLKMIEVVYFSLLEKGWQPQQARQILPFSIYSPLIMTGFVSDWKHFFELRTPKSVHPQARELVIKLEKEMLGSDN